MIFWGWYERTVRGDGLDQRVKVHRAMCKVCGRSQGLAPDLVAVGRLDGVEVIGRAVEEMAAGRPAAAVASDAGLPYTTVRDWRRRFAERASLLADGLLRAVVALGSTVERLPAGEVAIALAAIKAAAAAARRRFGLAGDDWRLANLVAGGHLYSTNTNPPWIAA